MRRATTILAVVAMLATLSVPAAAAPPLTADDTASLQAALDTAASHPGPDRIRITADIDLDATVTSTDSDRVTIDGRGHTITGPDSGDAIVFTGGADVRLQRATLADGAGRGLVLEVPADAGGVVELQLTAVTVTGFVLYGVHVDDGAGSPATMKVDFRRVALTGNGIQAPVGDPADDQDPLRVDETGDGDIVARFLHVDSTGNVYDGIELDETDAGSVTAWAVASVFSNNGDSGSDDVEDGFDIDEAGDGGIELQMTQVAVEGNFDEGVDLDEEDDGDVVVRLTGLTVSANADEGINVGEEGAGNLDARLTASRAVDGLDDGIDLEEADDGDAHARLAAVDASGNDGDGVKVAELGSGDLRAGVHGSSVTANTDDGIQVEQEAPGSGVLKVRGSDVSGNGDDDINADGVTVE